jgi:hypothetical protein
VRGAQGYEHLVTPVELGLVTGDGAAGDRGRGALARPAKLEEATAAALMAFSAAVEIVGWHSSDLPSQVRFSGSAPVFWYELQMV